MQKLFTTFLILSLLVGCVSSPPKSTKFDGQWEFYQTNPFEEEKACLAKDDVKKLRELLVRCQKGE